ncbi:hypothetical protein EDD11_003518 [Mortierella claussenii]|nr:hypothetical protein EDD11_003518 [Mortierella claussenii]
MAPKTPQANSKLPKPPSAGGPVPLTGIPPPASVLQRRSFMPTPGVSSVSKTLKDMSPEQQALLAEAISMHSPGLIDPARKTTTAVAPSAPSTTLRTSVSGQGGPGGLGGSGADHFSASTPSSGQHYQQSSRSISPSSNSDRASPTGLPSPASQRAPASQIGRRPSTSRLGMTLETTTFNVNGTTGISNASQQFSRPNSYSGMTPLSTSHPSLPTLSSTPSPTTPVSTTRPLSGSPSGSRPTLPASRLSGTPAIAPPTIGPTTGARSALMKQPLFQRPSGTAAPTPASGTAPMAAKTLSATIPGSTAMAPPSLDNYEIGDRVIVESMALSGYLRFLGPTDFKSGTWAGIELDTPTGKNDGSVGGVIYFHCRPKFGIFVLAAKVAKSELLFPAPPELSTNAHPTPMQEERHSTPSEPATVSHAAQAVSRITAGSRASKYIGMTASQLKQRNVASPSSTTSTASRPSNPAQPNVLGSSIRAASPTIRTLNGMTGSPTSQRTMASGAANGRANSPSPIPKPLFRASSPTARVAAAGAASTGNRLSQTVGKPTLAALNAKNAAAAAAHSRSPSSTSSVTSQSSANGSRARTSPTPRAMTTPRRLSSLSDASEVGNLLSPNESRSSLLDQATAIQTGSPVDSVSLQLQQLQLDFETAMAENNLLKSEISETKTRLEATKLLGKKDLSYDERTFLSKALGREGMDERLAQELEDLHAMKAVWDIETAAKDQELKAVTAKMTQAWLDTARSQKERTALIQEKTELTDKLKQLEENGGAIINSGEAAADTAAVREEQQALIESLQTSLQEAVSKTAALETKLLELEARTAEEEERLNQANEEIKLASEIKVSELELERDSLHAKLLDMEASNRSTLDALEVSLKAAQEEALAVKTKLGDAEARQIGEAESRRQAELEAEEKLKAMEAGLHESQGLLAKSEKVARGLEDKVRDHEALLAKRDQDIVGLKLELQDIAGMVQSEEVDRMRKVWELEKKRLEEAVADNITVMATLRSDIQTLEDTEEILNEKIKTMEASEIALKELNSAAEAEKEKLLRLSKDAEEAFAQQRLVLEGKVAETEASVETQLSEARQRIDQLETIAASVEEWKERCEAMQLEMIQKTAMVEDLGLKLADAQAQEEALQKQVEDVKKEFEEKSSADNATTIETLRVEISALKGEREQLLVKVSELEEETAALKQIVHELTVENAAVASDNRKLMQEHDILMEAHKHVETECLKLMDEVERLHSESLAVTSIGETESESSADKAELNMVRHGAMEVKTPLIGQEELKAALNNASILTKDTEKHSPQSASVSRLENLLKDKQTMLDRLTQAHSLEMRDLRQRYVELERNKSYEISQLNKELTDLESLIESKIFHEADLEEEVQQKQKQIDRLQHEISDLKEQLAKVSSGGTSFSSSTVLPFSGDRHGSLSYNLPLPGSNGAVKSPLSSKRVITATNNNSSTDKVLFCEVCEVEGHDLIACVAVFGRDNKTAAESRPAASTTAPPLFSEKDMEDDRPYCENCEEFGLHYTDECPNESLTY